MLDFGILWPALVAGLLVAATHVPLGIQVLNRGIVFIDLAVAQIAGLGVVFADWIGFEPQGPAVQISALAAAIGGALLLNWTEKLWPDAQEAVIGVTFVVAANAAILLLAANPHGPEHLKDLLVGQILWVSPARLPLMGLVSAVILVCG
jgi:zinc/manganese transport system permease protein